MSAEGEDQAVVSEDTPKEIDSKEEITAAEGVETAVETTSKEEPTVSPEVTESGHDPTDSSSEELNNKNDIPEEEIPENNDNVNNEISIIDEAEQILYPIDYNECPFSILTADLVVHIFSFLDIPDLVRLQLVSSDWFTYCRCDALWNPLYETTDWTLSPPAMELEQATWYDLYRLHYEKEIAQLSLLFFFSLLSLLAY